RLSADGGARDPAEGDARPDGDLDRVHAIGRAAAEASGAIAVAGGFARGGRLGGSSRSGSSRAGGCCQSLTRRRAASVDAELRIAPVIRCAAQFGYDGVRAPRARSPWLPRLQSRSLRTIAQRLCATP